MQSKRIIIAEHHVGTILIRSEDCKSVATEKLSFEKDNVAACERIIIDNCPSSISSNTLLLKQ